MNLRIRIIAAFIALFLCFEQISYAAADIKPQKFNLFPKENHISWAKQNLPDIPDSIATIEDAWKADSGSRMMDSGKRRMETGTIHDPQSNILVYLIADAHTNTSGQINLSKTLDLILRSQSHNDTRTQDNRQETIDNRLWTIKEQNLLADSGQETGDRKEKVRPIEENLTKGSQSQNVTRSQDNRQKTKTIDDRRWTIKEQNLQDKQDQNSAFTDTQANIRPSAGGAERGSLEDLAPAKGGSANALWRKPQLREAFWGRSAATGPAQPDAQIIETPFPIFIEAGSGNDSLSFLRQYSTLKQRQQAAMKYLKQGLLHGEEYLDLTSDHDFILWGVEDMALYQKALKSYKYVAKNRSKYQDYLKRIQQTIDTLKPKIYNPILLSFEEKQSQYLQEELSLTDYFDILVKYSNVIASQAKQSMFNAKIASASSMPRNDVLSRYPHLKALNILKQKEQAIDFKLANQEQQKAIQSLPEADQKQLLELQDKGKSPFKLTSQDHKELKGFYALLEEKLLADSAQRTGDRKDTSFYLADSVQRTGDSKSKPFYPLSAVRYPLETYPNLLKYFSYLKESKNLNPKAILDEQKSLETEILSFLAKTPDEQTLLQCQQTLRLLFKLFNLTLTPEEYQEYRTLTQGHNVTRTQRHKDTTSQDNRQKTKTIDDRLWTIKEQNNHPASFTSNVSSIVYSPLSPKTQTIDDRRWTIKEQDSLADSGQGTGDRKEKTKTIDDRLWTIKEQSPKASAGGAGGEFSSTPSGESREHGRVPSSEGGSASGGQATGPAQTDSVRPDSFTLTHLTGFLNKKILDYQSYYERALFLEPGYEEITAKSEEFYQLTLQRDKAFIENMLKKLNETTSQSHNDTRSQDNRQKTKTIDDRLWTIKEQNLLADSGQGTGDRKEKAKTIDGRLWTIKEQNNNPSSFTSNVSSIVYSLSSPKKAVLITGGFHTPNLKHLLKQHNISYISLTPQVTHQTNQKRYEELLLNQKITVNPSISIPSSTFQSHARLSPVLEHAGLRQTMAANTPSFPPAPKWQELSNRYVGARMALDEDGTQGRQVTTSHGSPTAGSRMAKKYQKNTYYYSREFNIEQDAKDFLINKSNQNRENVFTGSYGFDEEKGVWVVEYYIQKFELVKGSRLAQASQNKGQNKDNKGSNLSLTTSPSTSTSTKTAGSRMADGEDGSSRHKVTTSQGSPTAGSSTAALINKQLMENKQALLLVINLLDRLLKGQDPDKFDLQMIANFGLIHWLTHSILVQRAEKYRLSPEESLINAFFAFSYGLRLLTEGNINTLLRMFGSTSVANNIRSKINHLIDQHNVFGIFINVTHRMGAEYAKTGTLFADSAKAFIRGMSELGRKLDIENVEGARLVSQQAKQTTKEIELKSSDEFIQVDKLPEDIFDFDNSAISTALEFFETTSNVPALRRRLKKTLGIERVNWEDGVLTIIAKEKVVKLHPHNMEINERLGLLDRFYMNVPNDGPEVAVKIYQRDKRDNVDFVNAVRALFKIINQIKYLGFFSKKIQNFVFPVYVLGVVRNGHDSGAALFKNGVLLGAIAEERLDMEKHSPGEFPFESTRYLLQAHRISWSRIDHIAVTFDYNFYRDTPHSRAPIRHFQEHFGFDRGINMDRYDTTRYSDILTQVARSYGTDYMPPVTFVRHHKSHAAGAWNSSSFSEPTLVFVMDGKGEYESTNVWLAESGSLKKISSTPYIHSLGAFYVVLTKFLGYKSFDEGKVMGYAPYGAPTSEEETRVDNLRRLAKQLISFNSSTGQVEINQDNFNFLTAPNFKGFNFSPAFLSRLNAFVPPLPKEKRGGKISPEDRAYANFAFVMQERLEQVISDMVKFYLEKYSKTKMVRHVVLSGGLALNILSNGRLIEKQIVDNDKLYVPGFPGDDGTAIGAAWSVSQEEYGLDVHHPIHNISFGRTYTDQEIKLILDFFGLVEGEDYIKVKNDTKLIEEVAETIKQNKTVAWFQGGAELGPRALGYRSLLANLGDPEGNIKANLLKDREEWRPSAMAILEEFAKIFLKWVHTAPFMTMAFPVKEEKRSMILSGVHSADGWTRPQTVSRKSNPLFWRLLKKVYVRTGVPGVLNTSFNRLGPIVETPQDALNTFYYLSGIDLLAMGHYLIKPNKNLRPSILNVFDEENLRDQYLEARNTPAGSQPWSNFWKASQDLSNQLHAPHQHYVAFRLQDDERPELLRVPLVKEIFQSGKREEMIADLQSRLMHNMTGDSPQEIIMETTASEYLDVLIRLFNRINTSTNINYVGNQPSVGRGLTLNSANPNGGARLAVRADIGLRDRGSRLPAGQAGIAGLVSDLMISFGVDKRDRSQVSSMAEEDPEKAATTAVGYIIKHLRKAATDEAQRQIWRYRIGRHQEVENSVQKQALLNIIKNFLRDQKKQIPKESENRSREIMAIFATHFGFKPDQFIPAQRQGEKPALGFDEMLDAISSILLAHLNGKKAGQTQQKYSGYSYSGDSLQKRIAAWKRKHTLRPSDVALLTSMDNYRSALVEQKRRPSIIPWAVGDQKSEVKDFMKYLIKQSDTAREILDLLALPINSYYRLLRALEIQDKDRSQSRKGPAKGSPGNNARALNKQASSLPAARLAGKAEETFGARMAVGDDGAQRHNVTTSQESPVAGSRTAANEYEMQYTVIGANNYPKNIPFGNNHFFAYGVLRQGEEILEFFNTQFPRVLIESISVDGKSTSVEVFKTQKYNVGSTIKIIAKRPSQGDKERVFKYNFGSKLYNVHQLQSMIIQHINEKYGYKKVEINDMTLYAGSEVYRNPRNEEYFNGPFEVVVIISYDEKPSRFGRFFGSRASAARLSAVLLENYVTLVNLRKGDLGLMITANFYQKEIIKEKMTDASLNRAERELRFFTEVGLLEAVQQTQIKANLYSVPRWILDNWASDDLKKELGKIEFLANMRYVNFSELDHHRRINETKAHIDQLKTRFEGMRSGAVLVKEKQQASSAAYPSKQRLIYYKRARWQIQTLLQTIEPSPESVAARNLGRAVSSSRLVAVTLDTKGNITGIQDNAAGPSQNNQYFKLYNWKNPITIQFLIEYDPLTKKVVWLDKKINNPFLGSEKRRSLYYFLRFVINKLNGARLSRLSSPQEVRFSFNGKEIALIYEYAKRRRGKQYFEDKTSMVFKMLIDDELAFSKGTSILELSKHINPAFEKLDRPDLKITKRWGVPEYDFYYGNRNTPIVTITINTDNVDLEIIKKGLLEALLTRYQGRFVGSRAASHAPRPQFAERLTLEAGLKDPESHFRGTRLTSAALFGKASAVPAVNQAIIFQETTTQGLSTFFVGVAQAHGSRLLSAPSSLIAMNLTNEKNGPSNQIFDVRIENQKVIFRLLQENTYFEADLVASENETRSVSMQDFRTVMDGLTQGVEAAAEPILNAYQGNIQLEVSLAILPGGTYFDSYFREYVRVLEEIKNNRRYFTLSEYDKNFIQGYLQVDAADQGFKNRLEKLFTLNRNDLNEINDLKKVSMITGQFTEGAAPDMPFAKLNEGDLPAFKATILLTLAWSLMDPENISDGFVSQMANLTHNEHLTREQLIALYHKKDASLIQTLALLPALRSLDINQVLQFFRIGARMASQAA